MSERITIMLPSKFRCLDLDAAWPKSNQPSKCLRLAKTCKYSYASRSQPDILSGTPGPTFQSNTTSALRECDNPIVWPENSQANTLILLNRPQTILPATCFLDTDTHYQLPSDGKNPGVPVPTQILGVLSSKAAMHSICHGYLESTQDWLPLFSQKLLFQKVNNFNAESDTGLSLLLLCMKLVSCIPSKQEEASISSLYYLAKEYQFRVESSGFVSLQVLQSVVLLAVYEAGHAIYPAAHLSIGHAARLGTMMGLQDKKNATQLFKEAKTWSQCEEERRTWWSIIIFDR